MTILILDFLSIYNHNVIINEGFKVMKLQIIQIGNSLGIRIPKALLKQCGFKNSIVVRVKDNTLVLSPDNEPRAGWDEAFKRMARSGDDKLLDGDIQLSSDKDKWEW